MRTKTVLGLAVLAASAATVMAQNVYSLNIVGYVNVPIPAAAGGKAGFALVGNPLKASPDNTVATVIGTQLPNNSSLLTWNGVAFDENVFSGTWDIPDAVIAPGTGFFVKNQSATAANITFVGEVLSGLQTNVMANRFNLVSPMSPVAGDLSQNVNLNLTNAVANDSILTWNATSGSYDENVYGGGGPSGWDLPPTVAVGQGFFYKVNGAAHTVSWVTVGFP